MNLQQLAHDMAKVLTEYSSPVQPGEYVTVAGNLLTSMPLVEALYEAILRRGGIPNVQAASPIGPVPVLGLAPVESEPEAGEPREQTE